MVSIGVSTADPKLASGHKRNVAVIATDFGIKMHSAFRYDQAEKCKLST